MCAYNSLNCICLHKPVAPESEGMGRSMEHPIRSPAAGNTQYTQWNTSQHEQSVKLIILC